MKPNAQNLHNAANIVAFLIAECNKYHASYSNARRHINKYFWKVKEGDMQRAQLGDIHTIKGSCTIHQIRSMSYKVPILLQFQMLSCSYIACLERGTRLTCESIDYVLKWQLTRMNP